MIILVFILIAFIVFIEIYSYFSYFQRDEIKKINEDKQEFFKVDDIIFEENVIYESNAVNLGPSHIYTNDICNAFIIHNDEYILMEPGKLYSFETDYTLDFISNNNVIKYYISKIK